MNSKIMVVASKYQLLTRINGQYKEDGDKKLIFEDRVVSEDTVTRANTEHRGHGNIMWVVNEEKTAELPNMREEKALQMQAKSQAEAASKDDLAKAIIRNLREEGNKPAKKTKKAEPKEAEENGEYSNLSIDELKALCDERGIEYHHKAGKGKLIELLS